MLSARRGRPLRHEGGLVKRGRIAPAAARWGKWVAIGCVAGCGWAWAAPAAATEIPASSSPPVLDLFRFEDYYEISLGICVAFLFTALGWSLILRRKVKEQTEQIRQQMEREQVLEKRHSDLFEHANDLVLTLDPAGGILSMNRTGETILGCPRDRAAGLRFASFLVPAQMGDFDLWRERCLAGEVSPFEARTSGWQGRVALLELVGRVARMEGQVTHLDVIARDITERKQAEEKLRQSEERFSSAFRVSPVSMSIASWPEGRITDVNESFVKLFGFTRAEVEGKSAADLGLWVDAEDRTRMEQALREHGAVTGLECRFRVKDGGLRTTLVFMERITTGDLSCLLWLTHDMTDRLSLEAQLRHLLKMEAVGRLAAGVAHDFNNLLTVIQGNAEWVLMKQGQDPELVKPMTRINESVQRAAKLTRQLLTFSRKQNVVLRPLDVNLAVTTATKMFNDLLRSQITLKIKFAAALPPVQADATMLEQVLLNLVVNARDAMAHGGELTIKTSAATIDTGYVQKRPEASVGQFACLEVSDTGCGMPAATQARIFEPFFTTKAPGKGTGLGLATVYGIVKQHQGWLEVESEVGVGTTFKVFLPADPTAVLSPTNQVTASNGRESILLVEDEPAVLELLGRLLIDQGYRVHQASSGMEAIQIWSDHPSEIKLLLTDVCMPHSMSGFEVADNLLALNPDLKVIFFSGYTSESNIQEHLARTGATFLSKPCPPALLRDAVARTLQLRAEQELPTMN